MGLKESGMDKATNILGGMRTTQMLYLNIKAKWPRGRKKRALTSTPILIIAYAYANILATSLSSDALYSAGASVPMRTERFNHDIHAIPRINISPPQVHNNNHSLRSLANHTFPSTLTGVAIFLGTLTSLPLPPVAVIEW